MKVKYEQTRKGPNSIGRPQTTLRAAPGRVTGAAGAKRCQHTSAPGDIKCVISMSSGWRSSAFWHTARNNPLIRKFHSMKRLEDIGGGGENAIKCWGGQTAASRCGSCQKFRGLNPSPSSRWSPWKWGRIQSSKLRENLRDRLPKNILSNVKFSEEKEQINLFYDISVVYWHMDIQVSVVYWHMKDVSVVYWHMDISVVYWHMDIQVSVSVLTWIYK